MQSWQTFQQNLFIIYRKYKDIDIEKIITLVQLGIGSSIINYNYDEVFLLQDSQLPWFHL